MKIALSWKNRGFLQLANALNFSRSNVSLLLLLLALLSLLKECLGPQSESKLYITHKHSKNMALYGKSF